MPALAKKYKKFDLGSGLSLDFSDVDSNTRHGLIYGEVEFGSESEAEKFVLPKEVPAIREVTYEKKYKMKNYWKRTRIVFN